MPVLNKSSILFVLLNFLRFLSIVAICLAFSGEIVTMVSDLKTVESSHSSPTPAPSETASTRIFRRSFPDPIVAPSPSMTSAPTLLRREPTSLRILETASSTSSRRSSSTSSSSRAITATNSPSPTSAIPASQTCSYISSTSIPTQPGGSLFSTLSRIFCCLILLASLLSEFSPSITTRAGRLVERWWSYAFPPFGREFGTGVLGGVQVFMGCTILSHAIAKFTQVSGWFLFIVGILNLLCGLAFGSRLKIIRSPFADSTSPSALRKLRLKSSTHSMDSTYHDHSHADEPQEHEGGGLETIAERARANSEDRRKWYRFENASHEENSVGFNNQASTSTSNLTDGPSRKVRFTPSSAFGGKGRSASRNGPNGIVISAPMHLRGGRGAEGDAEVYGEMEEVRNGASSKGSQRGATGGISLPPPVYSGDH
ncbi:uncharacterized protein JCM6883_005829 [Sporobolomyces salmoneus]|uniref:uncharacterized protein n=1 Tax=Sporobolomyces salmoneus TaxID=183962 RepID=UPI003178F26F